jgi:protein SCO1/2
MVVLLLNIFFFAGCVKKKTTLTKTEKKECCKVEDLISLHKTNLIPSKDSVYQLKDSWKDQNNQEINLIQLQGKVQIVAMIFTNCASACPRIMMDLKTIESKIPEANRVNVDFLLISFDTERDTPEVLKQYANDRKLNGHWRLLHGTEGQVREMSMVLGVKYEKKADNNFAHSNVITVLNQKGEIVHQQEGLGVKSDETISKIIESSNSTN